MKRGGGDLKEGMWDPIKGFWGQVMGWEPIKGFWGRPNAMGPQFCSLGSIKCPPTTPQDRTRPPSTP